MATELEKKIMKKVYMLWFAKRVFNPLMLKLYFLAALTVELVRLVSMRNIIANWPSPANIAGEINFIAVAFMHTHLMTQAVTAVMMIIAALLIRDLFRHEDIGQFSLN